MKKVLVLVAAIAMFATPALAGVGVSLMDGTAHDLAGAYASDGGRICVYCHTPHYGVSVAGAPLWNRDTYAVSALTNAYDYNSSTLNVTSYDFTGGDIRLCLSCHDGQAGNTNLTLVNGSQNVAIGSIALSGGVIVEESGSLAVGLSDDHPVGFDYSPALATADGELYTPTSGTATDDLLFGAAATDGGFVYCSSCHDVHAQGTAAAGTSPFLRTTNSASALCVTCHIK